MVAPGVDDYVLCDTQIGIHHIHVDASCVQSVEYEISSDKNIQVCMSLDRRTLRQQLDIMPSVSSKDIVFNEGTVRLGAGNSCRTDVAQSIAPENMVTE